MLIWNEGRLVLGEEPPEFRPEMVVESPPDYCSGTRRSGDAPVLMKTLSWNQSKNSGSTRCPKARSIVRFQQLANDGDIRAQVSPLPAGIITPACLRRPPAGRNSSRRTARGHLSIGVLRSDRWATFAIELHFVRQTRS